MTARQQDHPRERAPRTVRFVLDGQVVTEVEPPPTLTVLEYLRERAGRTGTKEGCAEGDCGACTVVLGQLAQDGHVEYRAINSCIRFLPTIDGLELITVESLQDEDGTLHPVQQAMVDCHASQCGFCTPGFVMSLFALYLSTPDATRDDVVDALAGNLCRCTGYRPIIEAGSRMSQQPAPRRWNRAAAQSATRRARLAALDRGGDESQALRYAGFHAPRSTHGLVKAMQETPQAVLLAGGTDVGLWVTKQLRDLPALVYVGDVAELREIRVTGDALCIGAAVTLAQAWPAIVAEYPTLAEQAQRFASPPVRNSATLCGNLGNGSPIGDSLPILIALGASLQLRSAAGVRTLPLEQFYLGYQQKALAQGEVITAVSVPRMRTGERIASYKVSKRIEQDISAVSTGFRVQLAGGLVQEARLAYGGMAATARRAANAEQALLGRPWSAAGVADAVAALAHDFSPLTDMRASSAYRLRVAGALLERFVAEHPADGASPDPHQRLATAC